MEEASATLPGSVGDTSSDSRRRLVAQWAILKEPWAARFDRAVAGIILSESGRQDKPRGRGYAEKRSDASGGDWLTVAWGGNPAKWGSRRVIL